jgi:hypothetical protein
MKKIFISIFIIFYSLSSFSNDGDGWKPSNTVDVTTYPTSPDEGADLIEVILGNPNSPDEGNDPMNVPIDGKLSILLALGLCLAFYKIKQHGK